MIDVLIPLGAGSKHNDLELRYCLRSLEANVTGIRDIHIVGRIPDWIKNVTYTKFIEDVGPEHRQNNIAAKIFGACTLEELSKEFLVVHDDHFILEQFHAPAFPSFFDLTLQVRYNKLASVSGYRKSVVNTWDFLRAECKPTKYFDVHCPMVMEKLAFQRTCNQMPNVPFGHCLKSAYANFTGVGGVPYTDMKINESLFKDEILDLVHNRKWFSIGDRALNDQMKEALQELFPNPSKYEI